MIDIEYWIDRLDRTALRHRFELGFTRGSPEECWIWKGLIGAKGYGRFYLPPIDGRKWVQVQAHRVAYLLFVGPIPEGFTIDHRCQNHRCVNYLNHLEPVTNKENVLRGHGPTAINAHRTHCKSGHLLDESTVYLYRGSRYCRQCHTRWSREYATRQREKQRQARSQ